MRGKTDVSAPGADPQAQLKHMSEEPVDAASFLVKDFLRSIPRLTHQAMGVLGWLDAPVPIPVAVFLGILIVLVALGEPGLPPMLPGFRWLAMSIGIAGALALHVMNYVWWTPPGAPFVAGIQGRHLLPFVPFLFVAIDSPGWIARPLSRLRPVFIVAFLACQRDCDAADGGQSLLLNSELLIRQGVQRELTGRVAFRRGTLEDRLRRPRERGVFLETVRVV